MVTQQQLAEMLQGVNVRDVATHAGVSTKTVYRLREAANAPRLDTLLRILAAVKACAKTSKHRAKVSA